MGLRKRFRDWCPQPQRRFQANFKALSVPLLALLLIVEVGALLVAPIAYSALLLPKSVVGPPFHASNNAMDMPAFGLPLTDSQINAAWPHLPTAQQVLDSGYSCMRTSYSSCAQNQTIRADSDSLLAPPDAYICYSIWLQLNSTMWIQVPYHYLATNNPPYPQYVQASAQASSHGFLGTGLPTTYVTVAVAVIVVTSLAVTSYVLHRKRQAVKNGRV